MQLPTEIYDLITFHVEKTIYKYDEFVGGDLDGTQEHTSSEYKVRRQLASLRLASRGFCGSASRHLFRRITVSLYAPGSIITGLVPLVRFVEISKSRLAQYVREVELGFDGIPKHADDRPDLDDFAGMLSPCLARFANLKELSFGGPRPVPLLSLEETRSYINTVVMALRYVAIPRLEELVLHFPLCHDFGQFFPPKPSAVQIPITDILRQLQRLELNVCVYTTGRHQRHWRHDPILPEHEALPNQTHASYLYRMLEPAINLTSLSISSEDTLNLDPIKFSSSIKLRFLSLTGVSISAHNLLTLINQSSTTIESIFLDLVALNSETWHKVLLELSKLPCLIDFYIESSGYSSTGSSSHLATIIPPDPDYQPNLETYSKEDILALGALQRAVNANRIKARLNPFSKFYYMYIEDPEREAKRQYLYFES
ncbi:hypothetical protein TMatcc_009065 [Talaromyces marneffei ATCC 18224]|nr:hypothetical protein EYB25_007222 [Talaromyces marneffei]